MKRNVFEEIEALHLEVYKVFIADIDNEERKERLQKIAKVINLLNNKIKNNDL